MVILPVIHFLSKGDKCPLINIVNLGSGSVLGLQNIIPFPHLHNTGEWGSAVIRGDLARADNTA